GPDGRRRLARRRPPGLDHRGERQVSWAVDRVALRPGRLNDRLEPAPAGPVPDGERLLPVVAERRRPRLHLWLPLLPAGSARAPGRGWNAVGRLRLPDRDGLPVPPAGEPGRGGPDPVPQSVRRKVEGVAV